MLFFILCTRSVRRRDFYLKKRFDFGYIAVDLYCGSVHIVVFCQDVDNIALGWIERKATFCIKHAENVEKIFDVGIALRFSVYKVVEIYA